MASIFDDKKKYFSPLSENNIHRVNYNSLCRLKKFGDLQLDIYSFATL